MHHNTLLSLMKKVLDKSINKTRHCEWELKNQTVKNDNVCQPSLRACEAIYRHKLLTISVSGLLRKLAMTIIQIKFGLCNKKVLSQK